MRDALCPLRFEPIFKPAIWGGDALRPMLGAAPSAEPTGEAWLLSDQGDNLSRVVEGPLAGTTLRDLMRTRRQELIGDAPAPSGRFPLLLKFLDARQPLSVQVHPNDEQAKQMEPAGAGLGKTEAWVILNAEPHSLLFAGLRPGVDAQQLRAALEGSTLPEIMHSYAPRPGDCVFLEAGTIHAIGAGLQLFEVQQTSDITYRLYDWGRVDAGTGVPRQLHIEQALQCTNAERGPCDSMQPLTIERERERLVDCRHFTLDRIRSEQPFAVGAQRLCRILVCIEGKLILHHRGQEYPLRFGDVLLLPASIGVGECIPQGLATILECGIP